MSPHPDLRPKRRRHALALFLLFLATAARASGPCFELPTPDGNDKHLKTFQWVNQPPERLDVHPKLQHLTFHSRANDAQVGFYLYLPDGYDVPENAAKRYPAVYHLHGGRPGAEYKGIKDFDTLSQAMQDGRLPPALYVFPNGGKLSHYDWQGYRGEAAFLELVDHIDASFRTIARREGRLLQGGSQGGRGVCRYLFSHPERFSAGIAIAAGLQWEYAISEQEGIESKDLTIDDSSNNAWDLAAAYAADPLQPPVTLLIAIGDQDPNYQSNLAYHMRLNELGIDSQLLIAPDAGHGVGFSNRDIAPRLLEFATNALP